MHSSLPRSTDCVSCTTQYAVLGCPRRGVTFFQGRLRCATVLSCAVYQVSVKSGACREAADFGCVMCRWPSVETALDEMGLSPASGLGKMRIVAIRIPGDDELMPAVLRALHQAGG